MPAAAVNDVGDMLGYIRLGPGIGFAAVKAVMAVKPINIATNDRFNNVENNVAGNLKNNVKCFT